MDRISDSSANKEPKLTDKIEVLVVDDEEGMGVLLKAILRDSGYGVSFYSEPKEALLAFKKNTFPVVITDIKMPEMNGMEFLKNILEIKNDTSIIMITAFGSIENAVECMEIGAFNYITKPFKSEEICAVMLKAIERNRLIQENINLKRKLNIISKEPKIVGKSNKMNETLEFARKIATTNFKILITGESGTGKELIARYIHNYSDRSNYPFTIVQCSLLPETLLESELFGHKKGSFTGANQDKKGLLEEADKGTVFLDEIGDINLSVQGKLLRFLEEKEIKRVGDTKSKTVDVRLIFATNKNIPKLIAENQFRDDLYFRINEIEIKIPPLRERKEDIPLLTHFFLKEISEEMGTSIGIDPGVFELLISYDWSGNIRELRNCLTNAAVISEKRVITEKEIKKLLSITLTENTYNEQTLSFSEMRKKIVSDFDKKQITTYLLKNNGNITKTALEMQIDKKNLWVMLKKYDIDHKSFKNIK